MPHIIVEHSAQTVSDKDGLINTLHNTLATHDTVNLSGIKTRCLAVYPCIVGDNTTNDKMVHITLKLLPGRDDDLKTKMAKSLLKAARKYVDEDTSVTVEVADMHAASYQK